MHLQKLKKVKDTAVIYLFLSGGATHIETFNPIPNAPADRRSITGHVNTNVRWYAVWWTI